MVIPSFKKKRMATYIKSNLKLFIDLNIQAKTIKFPEGNIAKNIYDFSLEYVVLRYNTQSMIQKRTIQKRVNIAGLLSLKDLLVRLAIDGCL